MRDSSDATSLIWMPVDKLLPSEDNIRRDLGDLTDLADSIREHGVLQPLLVYVDDDRQWRVVAGHRRLAAAKLAEQRLVPVVGVPRMVAPIHRTAAMVVENTHRVGLSPMEEARALARLRDEGCSQRAIAERIGRTQAHVSRRLALLDLPEPIQAQVDTGGISLEKAVSIAGQLNDLGDDGRARVAELMGNDWQVTAAIAKVRWEQNRDAELPDETPTQGDGVEGGDSEGDAGDGVVAATGLSDIEQGPAMVPTATTSAESHPEPTPATPESGSVASPARPRDLVVEHLVDSLQRAIVELYDMIVRELDPHPGPIASYITDRDAAAAAQQALEDNDYEDHDGEPAHVTERSLEDLRQWAENRGEDVPDELADDGVRHLADSKNPRLTNEDGSAIIVGLDTPSQEQIAEAQGEWRPRYEATALSWFVETVPYLPSERLELIRASLVEHGHDQLDEALAVIDARLGELEVSHG